MNCTQFFQQLIIKSLLVSVILVYRFAEGKRPKDPDEGKRTPEFITSNGYALETHKITTEDGYILTYYRIPHGKSGPGRGIKVKPVIMLQHGLITSSACWFIQPEPTSLPFMLANSGYDVWLGNSRGTTYSRDHTNKLYNSKMDINIYWSFSWEHMGKYDIPAAIDYILKLTGKQKLIYLGHSQGTTQFFVMLSLRPEYNEKIQVGIMYAPVAFLGNCKGPFRLVGPIVETASISGVSGIFTSDLGVGKFINDKLLKFYYKVAPNFCEPEAIKLGVCANVLFATTGFDYEQTNFNRLNVGLSQFPDTTSAMSLVHYGQSIGSKRFAQFDYGVGLNAIKYGDLSVRPPDFNLSLVTAPVALYTGRNDFLSQKADVKKLTHMLPNIVKQYLVPWKKWNHVDYVLGKSDSNLLYKPTIKFLKKYLKSN